MHTSPLCVSGLSRGGEATNTHKHMHLHFNLQQVNEDRHTHTHLHNYTHTSTDTHTLPHLHTHFHTQNGVGGDTTRQVAVARRRPRRRTSGRPRWSPIKGSDVQGAVEQFAEH